jgi:hypothetical protein
LKGEEVIIDKRDVQGKEEEGVSMVENEEG